MKTSKHIKETGNTTDVTNAKNDAAIPEKLLTPVEPTLLANMERVVELLDELKYGTTFHKAARPYLTFIADKMSVTENQALMLSVFMEKSLYRSIRMEKIADVLGCRAIRMLAFMADIDGLIERKLIRRAVKDRYGDENLYYMPKKVIEAFKNDVVFMPKPTKGLTAEQFFEMMSELFDLNIECNDLFQQLDALVEDNPQLEYCDVFASLDCNDSDRMLLYILSDRYVNKGKDKIASRDLVDIPILPSRLRRLCNELQNGSNQLIKQNIVEYANNAGTVDNSYYKLTNKAKEMLFKGLNVVQQQTKNQRELLKHDTLAEKRMFYDPRDREQIEQLSELMMPEKFASVQQRLEENGMRKGFVCLFYGSPGTGKTETVYQLARRTQRDIMVVDVSQIKSKWVGESEQNIKAAFDRYRSYVKECERVPILLFNEADAILGVRMEGAQYSSDKMNNSIQNIILQEMEQLDGIMIATTNLTQNLDKAFERRFIYKIEFSRPSLEARRSIWQSMIPTLSRSLAEELAAEYDFSGGQIENIARKHIVEFILNGKEPLPEQIHLMCRTELLSNRGASRRRIGF